MNLIGWLLVALFVVVAARLAVGEDHPLDLDVDDDEPFGGTD